MFGRARNVGIDLGTTSVRLYLRGKGMVAEEPCVVAVDKTTGKVLRVGGEAQRMLGRTPDNIAAIHPVEAGVISDFDMTERMLRELLQRTNALRLTKPRVVMGVPSGITEVEERAAVDALLRAGAKQVYLLEAPVAAALGAGLDISRPEGHLVVDIGGGTTDIAVLSLGGVVECAALRVAGDQFDKALIKYIRRKHDLLIGEQTAEKLKRAIGCVTPRPEEVTAAVKGRCLLTGLPREVELSCVEMPQAFEEPVRRILEAIHGVLERTPPELLGDIGGTGITMTGGGSLLWGLDRLVEGHTGITTRVAEDAPSRVALGVGASLENLKPMESGVRNLRRRRQLRG